MSIGSPQIINFTTSNNCDYFWNEKNNVWIPQAEEDRLQEYELSSFHSIKKTTHTGIGASSSQPDGEVCEENESYDFSGEYEPPIDPMVAFQNKMLTVFEQLRVTQDIYGA